MSSNGQANKATSTDPGHAFQPQMVGYSPWQTYNGALYPVLPPYPPFVYSYSPPQRVYRGENGVATPIPCMIPLSPPGMVFAFPPPQGQVPPLAPVPAPPPLTKPKRRQVKMACTNCAAACKRCDEGRPCERCQKYGIGDSCRDGQRKERKKGGPYRRRNKKNDGKWMPSRVAAGNVIAPIPVAQTSAPDGPIFYPPPVTSHPIRDTPTVEERYIPANGQTWITSHSLGAHTSPSGQPALYQEILPQQEREPGPSKPAEFQHSTTFDGEFSSGTYQMEDTTNGVADSTTSSGVMTYHNNFPAKEGDHIEEECWMENGCEALLDPFFCSCVPHSTLYP